MQNAMLYDPAAGSITVDWPYLRRFPAWRRQAVALYCHEMVHILQWWIVCRRDAERWNNHPNPEEWPDRVQDVVLSLLTA